MNDRAKNGRERLIATKSHQLKQKEDQLANILKTLNTNQRFIKLLVYSLNSLDAFVTPPNREIRINARIIIRMDGVAILRTIGIINLSNEEVLFVYINILNKESG